MARPNPNAKLRILVWDNELNKIKSHFAGPERYDIIRVETSEQVINAMNSHPIPYFSLLVHSSTHAATIAKVRRRDPFMPQMYFDIGNQTSQNELMKIARAGCIYYAGDKHQLKEWVNNLFKMPSHLNNLTVVKMGGSSFDFDNDIKREDSKNLDDVCKALIKIFRDRPGKENRKKVNRILLTVGAGRFGDVIKEHMKKYGDNPNVAEAYPELLAGALLDNLELVYTHMGKENALHIKPGAFYMIGRTNSRKRIPLLAMAPHYILARDGIPLQDSDTHTIALAEFYGAERVVLIKRTDGIYDFDPYRGFILDQEDGRYTDLNTWIKVQEENKRYRIVSVDEMLSGETFSREGTGKDGKADESTGHLMEDSALEYMKGCQHVKEIVVVHIAPEEMYYDFRGIKEGYRHVVTGETLPLNTDWNAVLEQKIKDAFQGKANSKIVREK